MHSLIGIDTTSGTGSDEIARFTENNAALAANGTRDGVNRDGGEYRYFRAFAASDVAGTLEIQQSRDGATWWRTDSAAVPAGVTNGVMLEAEIIMPRVRARYVNGGAAQSQFEFVTLLVKG